MKSYNTIIGAMSVLTITTLAAFAHGEQTSEEGGALSWQDGESIFLDRAAADILRPRGFRPSLGWIGEF